MCFQSWIEWRQVHALADVSSRGCFLGNNKALVSAGERGVGGNRERCFGGQICDPPDPALCLRCRSSAFHDFFFFFSPPPLPHDGRASCGAGSQLCFLSQSPFMWSLPRVLPVDSVGRSDVFSPRRVQAGGPNSSYQWPRAAAIADASASANFHNMRHRLWFKSKKFTVSFPGCLGLPK